MSVVAPGARIGFVGLGNLGQPMARAMVRAGWSVAVLDTASEKAEPCVAEGARAAPGPGDLAGCAVVAPAVPDDAAAETVLWRLGPARLARCRRGRARAQHDPARDWAPARRDGRGARHRPARRPGLRGAERALAGKLTVMVGGEPEEVGRAHPVLEAVGSYVRHVGPSGAGSAAKLANQLMMFRQRESSKHIPVTLLEHLITIENLAQQRG